MSAAAKASVALVALSVLCGGCAAKDGSPADARAAGDAATLVVENNKWLDVNVYAVRNGTRNRLGTVTSMHSARFKLPGWVTVGAGELQLLIDPIGSGQTHTTAPIILMPGDRIEFKVADYLPLSAYSVLASGRR